MLQSQQVTLSAGQFADIQRKLAKLENENSVLKQEIIDLKDNKNNPNQQKLKDSITKNSNRQVAIQKMLAAQTDKTLEMRKDINFMLTQNQEVKNAIDGKFTNLEEERKEMKKKLTEMEAAMKSLREKLDEQSQFVASAASSAPPQPANAPASAANAGGDSSKILQVVERQLGMYDLQIAAQDLRFQVLEQTSYNGMLVWKITDYARRKKEAVSGRSLSLYSQPFFTSRYGYKMCTRVYLNGDGMGKNTHLSLFFVVMRGEYDAMLQWPFEQKVTLMLLDQGPARNHLSDTFRPDPTSSSFKKPTSDMNIASGCPLFVAHNVIENPSESYIKDDTIFVKVRVDTADIEAL